MAGPSGQTAKLLLPYPIPDDTVDVPRDVKALADRIEVISPSYLAGLYTDRPTASVAGRMYLATDTGGVYLDNGTNWTTISMPIVPALPTVGVQDNDEILLSVNVGITGALWHCKYDANIADAYKWYVIDGAPILARADASRTTANAQAAYGALPTDPIQMNLPYNGVWDVELQASCWSNANALANVGYSCIINGLAASDAWAAVQGMGISQSSCSCKTRHTVSGTDLRILERARSSSTAGHAGTFANRRILATPVRLAA